LFQLPTVFRCGGDGGGLLGGGGVVVGAGVGEEGGEGLGGGVGDGGPDGDLVQVLAVEALDVQGGEQSLNERFGGVTQDARQVRQFVQESGITDRFVGGLDGG
jgi:hypothetical protein